MACSDWASSDATTSQFTNLNSEIRPSMIMAVENSRSAFIKEDSVRRPLESLPSLLSALSVLGFALSLRAQVLVPVPTIDGTPVHCIDATGATVYTEILPVLGDTAQSTIEPSGLRVIRINQPVFTQQPHLVKLFIYAHECGHHMSGDVFMGVVLHEDDLNREKIADRIGIRILRDELHITSNDADQIASIFQNNPPMFPFYLPGPARAQWIRDCYATRNANCAVSQSASSTSDANASEQGASDNAGAGNVVDHANTTSSQLTQGYGVVGVNYLPLAQALPALANDMKDGFAFERKTLNGIVVATDGIHYGSYDQYCMLKSGDHDCFLHLSETSDGPAAKSEYEQIKGVMTSALPGWNSVETNPDPDAQDNAAHLIRYFELIAPDGRRVAVDVERGDVFKIVLSFSWTSH